MDGLLSTGPTPSSFCVIEYSLNLLCEIPYFGRFIDKKNPHKS